jgi:predicted RNase H-like nuclease (RuvC/YqgF family)
MRCICDFCMEKEFEEAEKRKKEYNENIQADEQTNLKVTQLKSEINQLENSPASQNLLKEKKEELRELENKLKKENTQQENKTKLILGIGLGILGVGLVGIVVYLIVKNKKENNNA